MRTLKKLTFLVLMIINLISNGQDKFPERGTVGLSATFQGQQLGIMVPIYTETNFVLAPVLDFLYVEEGGIDLGVGLHLRYLMGESKARPFIGMNTGMIFNMPEGTTTDEFGNEVDKKNTKDFLVGLSFGGEYFFDQHFSMGIECQGNMTISGEESYRFGNPDGINFNLATVLSANIYF